MLRVFEERAALASAAAEHFRMASERAIAARGRFTVALTGGSSARLVYGRMVAEPIDTSRIHFFWGDERAVPPDDPESNFGLARGLWLGSAREVNVHRVVTERGSAEQAALRYEQELVSVLGSPPVLDLIHLGMGPDGHVCSLFPGHPLLSERRRWVAALADSPKPPPERITFTLPTIGAAREVALLITGADKASALREVLEDPTSMRPAALVRRSHPAVTWFVEGAAAVLLGP